jgi:prolyl-tRNA editing enzyme YbaK/EbsC (Cys-tRNA(Pro) deacylase)
MKLGTLEIVPAHIDLELLAQPVGVFISTILNNKEIGVAKIDPKFSDTVAFCENYKIKLNQATNCVVLEAKRGEKKWFAVCVILGSTRADINGLARRTLDARRVSFASMEKAVEETGMEYGAITPVGLPNTWPILIDKAVVDSEYVVIGSGLRKSKLIISGTLLADLPNVKVLENLGQII